MLKVTIEHARCTVEVDTYTKGSVLAGTIEAGVSELRVGFHVQSPSPETELRRVVRSAKIGCYAEQMVRRAVPVLSTITVNGKSVEWMTE